jgi:hypothetical protein
MARLPKGAAWEYRAHGALFASGWYVRRNVDLRERVAGSPQTMAELDLLGFSLDVELRQRRLIGECKDRKGSTKEADRVIWLMGLGRLLAADHLLFAKPAIATATVRFARSTPVALYDEARVNEIESSIDDFAPRGAFDPEIGQELIRPAVSRGSFGDARTREAYDWIHNSSWLEPPISRVKRLPDYFALVEELPIGTTRTVMLAEGFLGLIACSLETAGRLRRNSPAVGDGLLRETMASGAASAGALREIAARADDYYRDILDRSIEQAQGKKGEVRAPRLADTVARPPDWTDSYLSLSRQLGSRSEVATDLLRFAELELIERFVAGRDPRPATQQFIRSDHRWLSGALSLAAGFCERVWGLKDPMFTTLRQPTSSVPPRDSQMNGRQGSLLPQDQSVTPAPVSESSLRRDDFES